MKQRLSESFTEVSAQTSDKIVEYVPQILLAAIVLIAGVMVAHAAKRVVLRFFDFIGLDKLACKVNVDRVLSSIGVRRGISNILGFLVYWLLILTTLLLMSEVLDLGTVSDAIGAIVAYIPNLIAGLLILILGLLVGRFFRDAVSTSLARANIAASDMVGHIAQWVIVIFVCIQALKQVGFDVTVITTHLAVILSVILISSGLAVALAIRPVLENYFICKQLKVRLKKGDTLECDGVHGEVVGFSLTSVIVRNGDSEIVLPARQLYEQRFTRKTNNN